MGSRTFTAGIALVSLLLLVQGLPVSAQDAGVQPTKLWETTPVSGATVNDVAIDTNGRMAAAVLSDGQPLDFGDAEVLAWDLARSKDSSEPTLKTDPNSQFTDPEGLRVVALEPARSGKADLLAVGNEGSSSDTQRNIYMYQTSRGPAAHNKVPESGESPPGAVEGLFFNDNGTLLLSQRPNSLVLFAQKSGTRYSQVDTWETPSASTDIVDVAVSRDLKRIVVSTVHDPTTGADTYHLRLLEIQFEGGAPSIEKAADPARRQTSGNGQWNTVAIDAQGDFVVSGTQDSIIFYHEIQAATADDDTNHDLKFSTPWTQSTPGAVTAVDISDDGHRFAAGFANGQFLAYEQTDLEPDGPLAARAIASPLAVAGTPANIAFTNQDTTVFLQTGSPGSPGAVYAFNVVQFDPSKALTPLWTVTQATDFAVSEDGNRFIIGKQTGNTASTVAVYEQAYTAELELDTVGQATPGETLTVNLGVANTGSAFDEYTITLADVPSAWSAEASPQRVSLLPGESTTVHLNLTPDKLQPPGDVDLTVEAESRFAPGNALAGSVELTVPIREVHAASVEIQDTSMDVDRGASVTFTATLRNEGNVDDTFSVEVRQDASWSVTLDGDQGSSRTVDVSAGDTHILNIALAVPDGAQEGSVNEVRVHAAPKGGGTADQASIRLVVEPGYGAAISGPTDAVEGDPGDQVTFDITVRNSGNTRDTFTARAFSNASDAQLLWEARLSKTTFDLAADRSETLTVSVNIPRGAEVGDSSTVTVVVRSAGSGLQEASAEFTVQVEETDDAPLPFLLVPLALGATAAWLQRRKTR